MGSLTRYLQEGFSKHCPPGWRARPEAALLDSAAQDVLGFCPRADVLLEKRDESLRVWVEFEVSRADPVANHAKFAAAHMFHPSLSGDVFVSMVSTHVVRGRRNLAAAMTGVMRRFGIRAFQTVLLPDLPPENVKALNHEDLAVLMRHGPPIEPEVARVILVSEEVPGMAGPSIHFVGDAFDVLLNIRQWNEDVTKGRARAAWGRRTVQYFVHDPWTGLFAPSKFCAYLPVASSAPAHGVELPVPLGVMTIPVYCDVDAVTPGFDGNKAWRHLVENLAFTMKPVSESPDVSARFGAWQDQVADYVSPSSKGPMVLTPPAWLR